MTAPVWTIFGISILIVLLLATGWWRYVLTGYLIARVTPYEQPGGGAGSILFIGDSTGYGTGASRSADSIAGRLGADYSHYSISNNSVNGRKIEGALEAVAELRSDANYDLIVLQIGANDIIAGRSAEAVVSDMESLIESVKPFTNDIVIITSGNVGATPLFDGDEADQLQIVSEQFDKQMITLAEQSDAVAFVSLYDAPDDDPFVQSPGMYTAIDNLHPTSAGYKIWYDKAKPHFDSVLEQR